MKTRPLLLCLLASCWSTLTSFTTAAEAARPNIIFILADDLGWRDLSCYDSPFCETPHIDRLAKEGLRFTQAYTAGSVCSPTRGSLMTGKYPVRTGITDYIPGLSGEGRKLKIQRTKTELALEEVTIGEAMQQGGYQTFYAGKWHLGGKGFEPDAQGFEVYVGDSVLGNHGKDWQVGERITTAATKFIDDRDSQRPFFMYLAYHEPHLPILEYPRHIDHFRDKASKLIPSSSPHDIPERDGQTRQVQDDAAYGSEVAGLDEWVGDVLQKLDDKGLAQDTIIVFFSDNGGLSTKDAPGPTSNLPLRAGKGWLYEGGIRVPLLVRAPGITKAGGVSDVPVISTDMYPTLLELAGLPLRPQQHIDGLSFASVLRGGAAPQRDTLYWHYPHYHGSTWAPGSAIRQGDWKLIEFLEENKVELYDLKTDLSERNDLATERPEVVRQLRDKLNAWRTETHAYIPAPNQDFGKPSAADATSSGKLKKGGKKKAKASADES